LSGLGRCYEAACQPEKAEAIWRELAAYWKDSTGAESTPYADALTALGTSLLQQNRFADAESVLRQALAIQEKEQPHYLRTFLTKSLLGASLLGLGKHALAEPLLLQGYEGLKLREAQIAPRSKFQLTAALQRLVQLYESWGKSELAGNWRKQLEDHLKQAGGKKVERK
jgi:tetratricopeptide (TPR) repeat protein